MAENNVPENNLISFQVMDPKGKWHTIEIPDDLGLNVMEACKAYELPIGSICGGLAICGHCHVYILSDHTLSPISDQEQETLDKLSFAKSTSRLCCQLHVDSRIEGLQIQLAPAE